MRRELQQGMAVADSAEIEFRQVLKNRPKFNFANPT